MRRTFFRYDCTRPCTVLSRVTGARARAGLCCPALMPRPTLLSDRPPSSEPDPATPVAGPVSDFGHWLTRDLRAKGTPSELPAAELPAAELPAAEPTAVELSPAERPSAERPSAERPSQHTVLITDAPEPELNSFLVRDLRPRGSVPPEVLRATLLASKWESVVPPDSLVPHAVSEAPPASLVLAPQLEAEDLAVLPSRGRGKKNWRQLVVLAALLSVAGALLWVVTGPQAEGLAGAAATAAPAMISVPLPPPPPAEAAPVEPAVVPEPSVAPVTAGTSTAAREPESDGPESDEPGRRGRRAGDAVARFADLPSPTLSRLAREEHKRARKPSSGPRSAKKPAGPAEP
ncbi:MAG: hypothetical protein RL033_1427 [Pseudomonadota bacterium]